MMGLLLRRFTVSLAVLLLAGCTSTSSPLPASSPSPSLLPGQVSISCDDPYPGHCLGLVAFAADHLPAGDGRITAITATSMPYPCPSASPCEQPPHRDDSWAAITLADGQRLGMWVVQGMLGRGVQSVGATLMPPTSPGPATVQFVVACGAMAVGTCLAVATGGVSSNTTPAFVSVAPRSRSNTANVFLVTYEYIDGTVGTVEVAPAPNSGLGWVLLPVTP